MVNNYIDLKFYETLEGEIAVPSSKFNRYAIQASSIVKNNTFGRINEKNVPYEVKYATCLIMEKLYEFDKKNSQIGIKKSESIGKVSVSYSDTSDLSKKRDEEIQQILRTYLIDVVDEKGVPLLYRGV